MNLHSLQLTRAEKINMSFIHGVVCIELESQTNICLVELYLLEITENLTVIQSQNPYQNLIVVSGLFGAIRLVDVHRRQTAPGTAGYPEYATGYPESGTTPPAGQQPAQSTPVVYDTNWGLGFGAGAAKATANRANRANCKQE